MKSLVILSLFLVAACTPVNMDKYVEAMSKDGADLKLQAAYMGGSISVERSMPTPKACK